MKYFATWAGRERVIEVRQGREGLEVRVDGQRVPVDIVSVDGSGLLNLIYDGDSVTYAAHFSDGVAHLSFHDRDVEVPIEDERTRLSRLATGGGPRKGQSEAAVKSLMPGVVKEIRVAPGDAVTAGQPLLILEAMKMENEIRAGIDGVVEEIHVQAGTAVEKGALLVSLKDPADAPTAVPAAP